MCLKLWSRETLRSRETKLTDFPREQSLRVLLYPIDHFTVVCLVVWPLNESEAGVDLALIGTSMLFICKFLLISMRTASLT